MCVAIATVRGSTLWRAIEAVQDVPAIAFSPDRLRVAAAVDESGGLFLWDLATHQRLVLARTATSYTSLSYSRDGTRLAAGSTDGAKLFDAATGEEVFLFEMPSYGNWPSCPTVRDCSPSVLTGLLCSARPLCKRSAELSLARGKPLPGGSRLSRPAPARCAVRAAA